MIFDSLDEVDEVSLGKNTLFILLNFMIIKVYLEIVQ